jgi:hypothetical protein
VLSFEAAKETFYSAGYLVHGLQQAAGFGSILRLPLHVTVASAPSASTASCPAIPDGSRFAPLTGQDAHQIP